MWQVLRSVRRAATRFTGGVIPWLLGNWRVYALTLGVVVALVVAPAVWRAAVVSRHSTAPPAQEATATAPAEEREDKRGRAPEFTPAFARPLNGPVLRDFGPYYSPVYRDYRWHEGVDLAAAPGEAVRAAAPGKVTAVERDPFWGLVVRCAIGPGWTLEYRGLGTAGVGPGQEVGAGALLGTVGPAPPAEAELSPHLHLVLLHNGTPVDPRSYLGP